MFFHVDIITTFRERWANSHVRDEAFGRLAHALEFEAEKHMDANRDMFMQLPERPAAKHIYHLLHQVVDEGAPHMENNCGRVQWMLGKYIRDGSMRERHFRKCLPENQATVY